MSLEATISCRHMSLNQISDDIVFRLRLIVYMVNTGEDKIDQNLL